jgi:hypothetical protein
LAALKIFSRRKHWFLPVLTRWLFEHAGTLLAP